MPVGQISCPHHILPQMWTKLITHIVRADHLTSQVPSHPSSVWSKFGSGNITKLLQLLFLIYIFWKDQISKIKKKLNLKKQCLLWAQLSDFISVKVVYSHIVSFTPLTSYLIWFILFYFILSLTFQCSVTWLKVPCVKFTHSLILFLRWYGLNICWASVAGSKLTRT